MNSVWASAAAVCVAAGVSELAGRLCAENDMVRFVRALAVLVLLTSFAASLLSADWEFPEIRQEALLPETSLSQYVSEQTELAAEAELEKYLQGLLGAADIPVEKIQASTDIGDDGCIVLTRVSAAFTYESDARRALALLQNTLGDQVQVEVNTDGQ